LIAARNGRFNVLKVLLDKGADINAQDNRGDTALMRAVTNATSGDETANDLKAVTLLLARGANVNLRDKNGFTALSGSELPGGESNPNYRAVRRMLKKAGAK
jgi:ankyrin repeat protein